LCFRDLFCPLFIGFHRRRRRSRADGGEGDQTIGSPGGQAAATSTPASGFRSWFGTSRRAGEGDSEPQPGGETPPVQDVPPALSVSRFLPPEIVDSHRWDSEPPFVGTPEVQVLGDNASFVTFRDEAAIPEVIFY
jgi:hypothetical protein